MSASPDLAGYAGALDAKRLALGRDVTFLGPEVKTWPAGTQVDDDGTPYDPFVEPVTTARSSDVLRCEVIFRQRGTEGAEASAFGWVETAHLCLIAPVADAALVEAAVAFTLSAEEYQVVSVLRDSPLPSYERILCYGRKA